jgi:hypothetical protein
MANNRELETGLRAMAKDFRLPGGGRKKLSQLVAGHLWWFDAAEKRGMGWRDVIRVLTAAGVTGRGGKPLSIGTLSSTVWRKRADAQESTGGPSLRTRPDPRPISSHRKSPREAKSLFAGQARRKKRTLSPQIADDHAQAARVVANPSKRPIGGLRTKNKDVLAFMDRAREVRRRSEEN